MKQAGCGSGRAGKRRGCCEIAQVLTQGLLRLPRLLVRSAWKHSASAIYATDQGGAVIDRRIDLKQDFRIGDLVGAGMAEHRVQWASPLSVLSGRVW